MKHFFLSILLIYVTKCYGQKTFTFPATFKSDVSDTIWHKAVPDPYRWLEQINSDSTAKWLKEQTRFKDHCEGKTFNRLQNFLSYYSHIKSKPIFREGKYYFSYLVYDENETACLYYQERIDDVPDLLFNPNTIEKKSIVNINDIALSADNKTLALVLTKNAGDWKTIRFLDIKSKKLLTDSVRFVKYSDVYWSGGGVFYIRYAVKDISESFTGIIKGRSLYYHRIGTNQDKDIQIFKPENDTENELRYEVTPKGNYLVLYNSKIISGKKYQTVSLAELPLTDSLSFRDFIVTDKTDVYFKVLGELNDKLLVETNLKAKKGAIYKYDPSTVNSAKKFVHEYQEQLEYSSLVNNKVLRFYNGDKKSYGVINDSTGKQLKIWTIPEGFSFKSISSSQDDSIILYSFDSFFSPSSFYQINLNSFEQKALSKTLIHFDIENLTTEKVYYYSKDSTLIPMYLTHLKNMKMNGINPVILYGYGGFGISMKPFLSVNNIVFLNNGGIFAAPCLRGGGDFPGWHEKGERLFKQNTFDDFISAAEFLVKEKYTNPGKIAAMGGSNGGLVVSACMLQRPDLFKVVVSESGVLDILRYHFYNTGYDKVSEFGNITDSIDFENLYRYSPVHNVRKGTEYPATLLVASDYDDRVLPFHSFKFISELQSNGTGKNPYVLYYQENAGHSGSALLSERIEKNAYIYSFIFKNLGIENKIYLNPY
ncbi:MAG: prolyl oligopeptidase family serine peptidase [Bacteroidota bacterium]